MGKERNDIPQNSENDKANRISTKQDLDILLAKRQMNQQTENFLNSIQAEQQAPQNVQMLQSMMRQGIPLQQQTRQPAHQTSRIPRIAKTI